VGVGVVCGSWSGLHSSSRLDYGDQGDKETPSQATFDALVADIHAEPNKFEELYQKYDQLRREVAEGRVFHGFTDCQPKFKPTFKVERSVALNYKVGVLACVLGLIACVVTMVCSSSLDFGVVLGWVIVVCWSVVGVFVVLLMQSQRSPAWCDRVLFRSLMPDVYRMRESAFVGVPEIGTSDHKPVRAEFSIDVFDLPSGFDGSKGQLTMHVRKLAGTSLLAADANGLSDPYVEFVGPFVEGGSIKTAHKPNTLNPVWDDAEVPPVVMSINSVKRLRKQVLMIAVVDRDVGSDDDLIGCGTVALKPLLQVCVVWCPVIPLLLRTHTQSHTYTHTHTHTPTPPLSTL
jgi:hypothetical protein